MLKTLYKVIMTHIAIERIKKDKRMKPYFLWFIKSNIQMPNMIVSVLTGKDSNPAELFLNLHRSRAALFEQLEKTNLQKEDYPEAIEKICNFYVQKLGKKAIIEAMPELLIIPSNYTTLN